jgi:DNA-binding transcriptional MerR regulator
MTAKQKEPKGYTIGGLEEATGLARRTIHYYIKEGLVAGPTGTGRNARYGEEHVLKLRAVKHLREISHWRLEGIREFMNGLSLEAIAELLDAKPPTPDTPGSNAEESGERHTNSDTWERVRISDEIEVHYKQTQSGGMDMSRKLRSLLAFARKLFGK